MGNFVYNRSYMSETMFKTKCNIENNVKMLEVFELFVEAYMRWKLVDVLSRFSMGRHVRVTVWFKSAGWEHGYICKLTS